MTVPELWAHLEKGGDVLLAQAVALPDEKRLLLLANELDRLPEHVKAAAAEYVEGKCRDLLRSLEHESANTWSVILRVLCLLRMSQSHETIGETDALKYLRDRVLPRIKQVEVDGGTPELHQRQEWLERFCLGHELPDEFWDALAE